MLDRCSVPCRSPQDTTGSQKPSHSTIINVILTWNLYRNPNGFAETQKSGSATNYLSVKSDVTQEFPLKQRADTATEMDWCQWRNRHTAWGTRLQKHPKYRSAHGRTAVESQEEWSGLFSLWSQDPQVTLEPNKCKMEPNFKTEHKNVTTERFHPSEPRKMFSGWFNPETTKEKERCLTTEPSG